MSAATTAAPTLQPPLFGDDDAAAADDDDAAGGLMAGLGNDVDAGVASFVRGGMRGAARPGSFLDGAVDIGM